ncbi:MAG TPA: DNA helicase RecQ [Beijerinckiaceae bacterium]|jgi:ATP-dependent DNA helicase RecQ|nr:DNA helicase RecQ [Beijerinckiaceae bacterium]
MTASTAAVTGQPRPRDLLKSVFGYDGFRPGQEQVVEAVIAGRSVLAVMPTGSGKSICYQLPALLDDGATIVISPLIALMRDQVRQLKQVGVVAASLNSLNSEEEIDEAWAGIRSRKLRLLFIAPERLAMPGLAARLASAGFARIAVDEAHCISEWGHDFRPEYRDLRSLAGTLGIRQIVAFTATADQTTRNDIASRLFDGEPDVFLHSFDRPNLHLRFAAKDQPRRQLLDFLRGKRGQSGIVYCASRKKTEDLSAFLNAEGHAAIAYHAGMEQRLRNQAQDRFLQDEGVIAVATIAFGMGINKPDVRFVVHADMPSSVEAYYQEIGRAGRDGLPAETLTLYGLDDMALRRRQIDERDLSDEQRRVEHRRFGSMAMLCEATSCRRQLLLGYFDEESAPCGQCDCCRNEIRLADGQIEAQKVLSAVARTGQRFGVGYLTDILRGTMTDAVRRNGHDKLKTFGVGQDRGKAAWSSIIRQLFAAGALVNASEEFGGFALSETGLEILRGERPFLLRETTLTEAPKGQRRRRGIGSDNPEEDNAVLAALRTRRRELAREQGVPAFMIFADRTLIEMAERRPETLDQMAEIYGVGERKLKLYGDAFLEALAGVA